MKKVLAVLALISMAAAAWASPPERYLHVRVNNLDKQEKVSINLPLSVAAQTIPAIDHGALQGGKIQIGSFEVNGVDVMQVLGALQNAPDGDFVTIEQPGRILRVAKRQGELIVHVANRQGERRTVDVAVPWTVAAALVSPGKTHELNVEAAIQALQASGSRTQVTVSSDRQLVSIWVDTQSETPESGAQGGQP